MTIKSRSAEALTHLLLCCRVCRALGLTRSFEQEDMHELAKVAGFMGSPHTGSQQATVLSLHQWNTFGKWFIG